MLETLALRRALLCGGLHLAQSAISSNMCWGLSVKECLLYPLADIRHYDRHARFVPQADIGRSGSR